MSAGDRARQRLDVELAEEQDHFLSLVDGLSADHWRRETPADRWTIHDQVAHVVLVEELAAAAVGDPAAFAERADRAAADPAAFESDLEELGRSLRSAELLQRWRAAQRALRSGVAALRPGQRVRWFGPSMSPTSFLAARLMETWAHGQDVRDALGVPTSNTRRLRTIADLGVRTRAWSYQVRDREPNAKPLRVELAGMDDEPWQWGDGPLGVRGTALDFCLVVTQRRHWADTGLVLHDSVAEGWLEIAQAFAGPATTTSPGRGIREATTGKEVP